jgi:predicted ATPase
MTGQAPDPQPLVALALDAHLAVDLMRAVEKVARKHGYTDVVILTDGTSRIAATPPARRQS